MHTSFDTEGFFFSLKCTAVLALFFGIVHFGAAYLFPNQPHASATALTTTETTQSEAQVQKTSSPSLTSIVTTVARKVSPSSLTALVPQSIEAAVPEEGKFIAIDLNKMKLYTYEDSRLVGTYDVISKGRPGSRWETPSGSYTVQYKNAAHFSSIGEVYMPYSMQFFGNFFIHGWPYYPDGTPVDEGYSGGCVRLSTPDSKEVYEFADISTSVYVYDAIETSQTSRVMGATYTPPPTVSAASFLVADLETGRVFAEKEAETPRPIASISKLMTAVVANEAIAYNKLIGVSATALATYGTQGNLYVGQRMSLQTMLHPLLLESSNDAAEAIAEYLGRTHFIDLMNRKASALNMVDTSFADPSGLSPHNISTPADLFKLAHYIYGKKRFIFDISTLDSKTLTIEGTGLQQTFKNNNPLRSHKDYVGGKNGYTDEARKTLLTVFETEYLNDEFPIIVIVLGSEQHAEDTKKLYQWVTSLLQARSE